ncbi:MAG: AMP-binding protein [Muribaculaceae bacterium]|nr:AMP-binding protein [Muribaculaceae bacterium]
MKIRINNAECESVEEVRMVASKDVADFIEEYLNDNDFVLAHTSGSTGEPKEVRLLKSDMRASASLTNEFFGINKASVLYLCLSTKYIAGKMMIVRALEAGAQLIEEEPSNTPLAKYDGRMLITMLACVPSQIGYLINNPEKLQIVKHLIIGGGKLNPRTERWLAEYGVNAHKTFGMTETCSHVALSEVAREDMPYKALGEVCFDVDDRQCLVINAPHLSCKQIITNDVVSLVSDTEFVWHGRFDNVINSGGVKLFPEEIERKLVGILPNVRFYVKGMPSEKWGEEPVIMLEYTSLPAGTEKHGDVQPALIEKMRKVLPPHSIPRRYIAVPKFDEASNGKIRR